MESLKEIAEHPRTDTKDGMELKAVLTTVNEKTDSQNESRTQRYECSKCEDRGWNYSEERRGMVQCDCIIPKTIKAALPLRFQSANLIDFKPVIIASVTEWLLKPTDGMLLYGGVGSGKTHLAAAIFRQQVESKKRVRFTRMADFYLKIRKTYSSETDFDESWILKDYESVPLVILDDLGAGSLSDSERRLALELIDRRMNALKPTIVTSNWSLMEISQKMDERIADRLNTFKLIAFSGESKRGA